MEFHKELLAHELQNCIIDLINNSNINYNSMVHDRSIKMLSEIRSIISNPILTDFLKVDAIVTLLNENGISTGGCHDF